MRILSIDPGLSGAAVILEQIGGAVMLVSIIDLPTVGEGAKRRLDAFTFARWLYDHAPTLPSKPPTKHGSRSVRKSRSMMRLGKESLSVARRSIGNTRNSSSEE
jgi:hypothetical protein